MRTLFELMVPHYIPIALVSTALGFAFSGGHTDIVTFIIAMVAIAALVGGANAMNCVTDVRIDRINKPGRPLPAGRIDKRTALVSSGALYCISIVLAIMVGTTFMSIFALALLITLIYNIPSTKLRRSLVFGNITGTIIYGLLFPLAGWAIMPSGPVPLFLLPFTALLIFALTIAKDMEDIVGDKAYGILTLPVALGVKNSAKLTAIGLVLAFGYLVAATFVGLLATQFAIILIILPVMLLLIREMWTCGSEHHIHRGLAKRIFLTLIGFGIIAELALTVIAML